MTATQLGVISRSKAGGIKYAIVGVVADVQKKPSMYGDAPLATEPVIYLPAAQTPASIIAAGNLWFQPSWIVRTRGPVSGLTEAMQRALAEADPDLPFSGFYSMRDLLNQRLQMQHIEVTLLGVLAGLALLLSSIGVYALVSNLVVQRTREIGIRIALGCTLRRAIFGVGSAGATPVSGRRLGRTGVVVLRPAGVAERDLWRECLRPGDSGQRSSAAGSDCRGSKRSAGTAHRQDRSRGDAARRIRRASIHHLFFPTLVSSQYTSDADTTGEPMALHNTEELKAGPTSQLESEVLNEQNQTYEFPVDQAGPANRLPDHPQSARPRRQLGPKPRHLLHHLDRTRSHAPHGRVRGQEHDRQG